MADETEYFWDEATGMYYYYDEEQEAYAPYIEEAYEEEEGEPVYDEAVEEEEPAAEPEEEIEEEPNIPQPTLYNPPIKAPPQLMRNFSRRYSMAGDGAAGADDIPPGMLGGGLARTGTMAQVDLDAAAAEIFNPARRNRKTTMRFGTRDFGNPNAGNTLAQMLTQQPPGRMGHRASYGGEFETKPL
eukprot:Selendium_serpulae@DN4288_c0_g1_i2.p1